MKPRRTNAKAAEMRWDLQMMLMTSDVTVKQIQAKLDLSHTYVCSILRRYGYSNMLVSERERSAILAVRLSGDRNPA